MEHELSDLRVFYGWSRLNKIRKKRAISVIFENCQGARYRGEQLLKRMQDTCYVRKQQLVKLLTVDIRIGYLLSTHYS